MSRSESLAFTSPNRFPSTAELLSGIDLGGKFAVVTGASGGLGLETASALARAGADIIVAGRAGDKLDAAVARIESESPGRARGVGVDLADVSSVDAFADTIVAARRPIDYFVANAGVIGPQQLTPLGIELGFMTNVVSHAILVSRLSPHFPDGARLAFLSSFGHHYSPVVFDDINFESRPYNAWLSYGQSKTGCSLLAVKVSDALRSRGVDAFGLHPGAIKTEMSRSMTAADFAFAAERTGKHASDEFKTPDEGAATTIWALTAPGLAGQGGVYLEDCGIAEIRHEPDYRSGVMPYAVDSALADRLWETVGRLVGRDLPLS